MYAHFQYGFFTLFVLLSLFFPGGCGTRDPDTLPRRAHGLMPMPALAPQEPGDADLEQALRHHVRKTRGPGHSGYQFTRIDLNGDGMRDALVHMRTPFGHWCGSYGCALLVFRADPPHGFTWISTTTPVQTPFIVADQTTHGWRNFVVRMDGRWDLSGSAVLKYDGRGYPETPRNPVPENGILRGTKVFP